MTLLFGASWIFFSDVVAAWALAGRPRTDERFFVPRWDVTVTRKGYRWTIGLLFLGALGVDLIWVPLVAPVPGFTLAIIGLGILLLAADILLWVRMQGLLRELGFHNVTSDG